MTCNSRILCSADEVDPFKVEYLWPFRLPEKADRTVFMVYKTPPLGSRTNNRFFGEYGTSLGFGVLGGATPEDNGTLITQLGGTFTNVISLKIGATRIDNYEMSSAGLSGIVEYGYTFETIAEQSSSAKWATVTDTSLTLSRGYELLDLLYYDRALTPYEIGQVQQYLIKRYDLYSEDIIAI